MVLIPQRKLGEVPKHSADNNPGKKAILAGGMLKIFSSSMPNGG